MIKLNTRVACAVTAALLASSLFCGVSSHEVEAENSYYPATPQITMDPNRVLKVTDTTDWGQTHTDSNEVSVLDYGKIVSDEISSGKAVDVSCGTDLIVSVGDDGNLYSCDSKGSKLKKLEVAGNPKFTKVACGSDYAIALTSDGELYSWGNDFYGQLGDGKSGADAKVDKPTKISLPNDEKATDVSCGSGHSAVITSKGKLYTWGCNAQGQLGNGATEAFNVKPQKIALPSGHEVAKISCGFDFTAAVDSEGNLFLWGYNSDGGQNTVVNNTPVQVSTPGYSAVTSVSCGNRSMIAITDTGETEVWGISTDLDWKTGGVNLKLSEGVKAVSADTGCEYAVAVGDDGNVYAYGSNKSNQLGIPNADSTSSFVLLDNTNGVKFSKIACGGGTEDSSFTVALAESGKLYSWGSNRDSSPKANLVIPTDKTTSDNNVEIEFIVPDGDTFGVLDYKVKGEDGKTYGLKDATSATLISSTGETKDVKALDSYNITSGSYTLKITGAPRGTFEGLTTISSATIVNQNFGKILYSIDNGPFMVYAQDSNVTLPKWETSVRARVYNDAGAYTEATQIFNVGIDKDKCTPNQPEISEQNNTFVITDTTDWTAKDQYGNLYQSLGKIEYSLDGSNWKDWTEPVSEDGLNDTLFYARITNTDGVSSQAIKVIGNVTLDGLLDDFIKNPTYTKSKGASQFIEDYGDVNTMPQKLDSSIDKVVKNYNAGTYPNLTAEDVNAMIGLVNGESLKNDLIKSVSAVVAPDQDVKVDDKVIDLVNNFSVDKLKEVYAYVKALPDSDSKTASLNKISEVASDYLFKGIANFSLESGETDTILPMITQDDLINHLEECIKDSNIKNYDGISLNSALDAVQDEAKRNDLSTRITEVMTKNPTPVIDNVDTTNSTVTMSWYCVGTPDKYCVSIITGAEDIKWIDVPATEKSYTFENLLSGTDYIVSIKAVYGDEESESTSRDAVTLTGSDNNPTDKPSDVDNQGSTTDKPSDVDNQGSTTNKGGNDKVSEKVVGNSSDKPVATSTAESLSGGSADNAGKGDSSVGSNGGTSIAKTFDSLKKLVLPVSLCAGALAVIIATVATRKKKEEKQK